MAFVYIHIVWFACWIGFGVENYPYGLLTMIVSLEAIFLSTFVMISQNRADAKRQVIADQQWQTVEEEDRQNEELLGLARQILDLTEAIHADTTTGSAEAAPAVREEARTRSRRRPRAAAQRPFRGCISRGRSGRRGGRRRGRCRARHTRRSSFLQS